VDQQEPQTTPAPTRVSRRWSRRDFARLTVLGAVACVSTRPAKAVADHHLCCDFEPLTIDHLTDPDGCAYVGQKCARFLRRVDQYEQTLPQNSFVSIEDLVFGDFQELVQGFMIQEESNSGFYADSAQAVDGLGKLNTELEAINQGRSKSDKIHYSDFFTSPNGENVRGLGTWRKWKRVYAALEPLMETYPFPFLSLSPGQREKTRRLLEPVSGETVSEFRKKTGHIRYLDLFLKARQESCATHISQQHRETYTYGDIYRHVRTAFQDRLFGTLEPSENADCPPPEGRESLASQPNNTCWYSGQGCREYNNTYCATSNGEPTASSDICG